MASTRQGEGQLFPREVISEQISMHLHNFYRSAPQIVAGRRVGSRILLFKSLLFERDDSLWPSIEIWE